MSYHLPAVFLLDINVKVSGVGINLVTSSQDVYFPEAGNQRSITINADLDIVTFH
jgi:hypothetical protein